MTDWRETKLLGDCLMCESPMIATVYERPTRNLAGRLGVEREAAPLGEDLGPGSGTEQGNFTSAGQEAAGLRLPIGIEVRREQAYGSNP